MAQIVFLCPQNFLGVLEVSFGLRDFTLELTLRLKKKLLGVFVGALQGFFGRALGSDQDLAGLRLRRADQPFGKALPEKIAAGKTEEAEENTSGEIDN